jgi:phycocyanin-associated rod linker protein
VAITTEASRLGVSAFYETAPVELRPNWTVEEAQIAINAVYRQVLGNDYIMNSERLTGAESLLSNGSITVRDFVRLVAKSELYKTKFLYNSFQTRTIELNFKHLLGRAPYCEAEVIEHLDRYQNEGYGADIDSYIDSDEYVQNFGDNIVPFYRGFETQTNQTMAGFPRMFQLYRGYATSDRSALGSKYSRLASDLAANKVNTVVAPSGTLNAWNYKESVKGVTPNLAFQNPSRDGRVYRVEVATMNLPRYPKARRINKAIFVPFDQLLDTMQQVRKMGGKVASVTLA